MIQESEDTQQFTQLDSRVRASSPRSSESGFESGFNKSIMIHGILSLKHWVKQSNSSTVVAVARATTKLSNCFVHYNNSAFFLANRALLWHLVYIPQSNTWYQLRACDSLRLVSGDSGNTWYCYRGNGNQLNNYHWLPRFIPFRNITPICHQTKVTKDPRIRTIFQESLSHVEVKRCLSVSNEFFCVRRVFL